MTPSATTAASVVIFDFGEVLATPPDLYAFWSHRDAYDRGGTAQAFWSTALADHGTPVTPSLIAGLAYIDTQTWSTIRPHAMCDANPPGPTEKNAHTGLRSGVSARLGRPAQGAHAELQDGKVHRH